MALGSPAWKADGHHRGQRADRALCCPAGLLCAVLMMNPPRSQPLQSFKKRRGRVLGGLRALCAYLTHSSFHLNCLDLSSSKSLSLSQHSLPSLSLSLLIAHSGHLLSTPFRRSLSPPSSWLHFQHSFLLVEFHLPSDWFPAFSYPPHPKLTCGHLHSPIFSLWTRLLSLAPSSLGTRPPALP